MQINKVCIVDDDDIYRLTTRMTLEKLEERPSEVLEFADGERALKYILTNKDCSESLPDLILLDINMPVMDGWDFLEAYSEIMISLAKNIPIFMVSSSVDPAEISRAENTPHVIKYISKPLSLKTVKEVLYKYSY